MLAQLQELHSAISANLDELDALTRQPTPSMDRLASVRLALTRASRSRTLLLGPCYESLIDSAATHDQCTAIRKLRDDAREQLTASIRHIGRWTPREIAISWSEYCAASCEMRTVMRRRLEEEARTLYPVMSGVGTARSVA